MPWQPAYNAFGAEPLIRQMLALVYRDIQAALDFVSGAPGSLPPFTVYQLAESVTPNFPAILMVPQSQTFDPSQANVAHETVRIFCAVAAAHQDPNAVAVLVQRYAMAVWHVLTAAFEKTSGDFLLPGLALPASAYGSGAMTSGLPGGALKRLFVAQPEYAELRQAKSMFVKAAGLAIEADLFEA
ncbi:MAG TPA: hypothetical protein VFC10_07450 [Terriglobia bacterium]|jgi:hypothetical protein|nr:hypothetical protein [Terracidiphilus sp.]HZT69569.1 hypothetical protein [Terriglobia bacterium]